MTGFFVLKGPGFALTPEPLHCQTRHLILCLGTAPSEAPVDYTMELVKFLRYGTMVFCVCVEKVMINNKAREAGLLKVLLCLNAH